MIEGIESLARRDGHFEEAQRTAQAGALIPDERPDVIFFPRTEADVAAIVKEAVLREQKVAVRSGGHSWAATSLRDGGVLIDLRHLTAVEIDVAGLIAWVQPGIRGGRLGALLTAAGVAFPVGHCGSPGVGGYLLGGGLGVNWGQWRPAVSSIRSMRLVTATGDIIVASETENPDWFWLARGAGPALPAVATLFELRLQPMPTDIRVSAWSHSLDALEAVAAWLTEASRSLPASVELPVVLAGPGRPGATLDDEPFVVGVTAIAYTDSAEESAAALAPLTKGPDAVPLTRVDLSPARFDELHVPVDQTYPEGSRFLVDTFWTDRELGDVLLELADLVRRAPSGKSYVLASMPAHGAGASLVNETETSYSLHDRTVIIVYAVWDDPANDARNAAWLDALAAVLDPITTGHFLSEADIRRRPARVAASFSPLAWRRILQLRARFDPHEVFHTFPVG